MSKKIKILIVIVLIALGLAVGGIFIWKNHSPKNSSEKTKEPAPNQSVKTCVKCGENCGSSPIKKNEKIYCSQKCAGNGNEEGNNKEKDLVEKIKTDLQVRLERVKNGSRELEDLMPYIIQGKKVLCNVGDLKFIKDGEEISSDDIGEENFQLIVNLFKQIRTAKEKWEEKMKQKAQEKADANPSLFYFPVKGSFIGGILTDDISHWQFDGRQDGKTYKLIVPLLHPNLTGISIKSDDWNIYRIIGVENIPLVSRFTPKGSVKKWLYKIVKLSDHFTIKKIDF